MRKVKCAVTGEWGTNETFVKIGDRYYKSQEVYDEYRHDVEARKGIIELIAKGFLDYRTGQKFPTLIQTKLKDFQYYSSDVILGCLNELSDIIRHYMYTKDFKNDSQKIGYIFAILSNHISDYNKAYQRKKREEAKQTIATEIPADDEVIHSSSAAKDISDWLDEDDI